MIINYRRVFQVGIKVNKTPQKDIVIVDYAKQCYPKIEEENKDNKIVFHFYYPEALRKYLEDVNSGRVDSSQAFSFAENYQPFIIESSLQVDPFFYSVKLDTFE